VHHVFVSYSRRDEARVRVVLDRLRAAKVPYWVDTTELQASDAWRRALTKAIVASSLVAVFDSPDWRRSKPCQEEYSAAGDADKTIVVIPTAPTFDAQQAAAEIITAHRAYSRGERARTELLVRSEEWVARGRARSLLASRRLLKELNLARGLHPDHADAYIFASLRRNALRRALAIIGSLVSVALLGLLSIAPKVLQGANEKIQTATADLVQHVRGYDAVHWNVYAGLQRAADRITADSGYLDLVDLMSALDVEVPDHADLVTARSVAGLVPRSADQVGVISTAGHVGVQTVEGEATIGALAADETVTSVASDAQGKNTLVATAGRSFFSDGSVGSCGGDVAAVGADGSRAVADTAQVCIWPPGTKTPVQVPRGDVTSMAFIGPDLAVGAADGSVTAYAADGGTAPLVPASGHAVVAMAGSADGRLLAVTHADDAVVDILDPASGEPLRSVLVDQPPTALAFGPGSRVLAVAAGPRIGVVDVNAGVVQQTLQGNFRPITEVAWSPDGGHVWAATDEQRVLRWTWRHGTVLVDEPDTWLTNEVGLPDGGALVLVRDGTLLRIGPDGTVSREESSVKAAAAMTASADGSTVAIVSGNAVVLHRLGGGRETKWTTPDCFLQNTAFSPDGDLLYLACGDDGLAALEVATGTIVARAPTDPGVLPYSLVTAPDGALFVGGFHGDVLEVSADLSQTAYVHHQEDSSCTTPRRALAVSSDGSSVVAVGDGGAALGCVLLATRDGSSWTNGVIPFESTSARQARAVAVSPDGTLAAIGFGDGSVAVVTVPDGNPGWTWHELTGAVRGLSFSPDGQSLTAATRDGLVTVLPTCPECDSPSALAAIADERVQQALDWGLVR
jgi:WD40 repeat protein